MATVKKYNLAGVSTSLELGKQGSYITGNADAIGFYTSGDALQKVAIANATASTEAVTKGIPLTWYAGTKLIPVLGQFKDMFNPHFFT